MYLLVGTMVGMVDTQLQVTRRVPPTHAPAPEPRQEHAQEHKFCCPNYGPKCRSWDDGRPGRSMTRRSPDVAAR